MPWRKPRLTSHRSETARNSEKRQGQRIIIGMIEIGSKYRVRRRVAALSFAMVLYIRLHVIRGATAGNSFESGVVPPHSILKDKYTNRYLRGITPALWDDTHIGDIHNRLLYCQKPLCSSGYFLTIIVTLRFHTGYNCLPRPIPAKRLRNISQSMNH